MIIRLKQMIGKTDKNVAEIIKGKNILIQSDEDSGIIRIDF
jgi:hypothetical protein